LKENRFFYTVLFLVALLLISNFVTYKVVGRQESTRPVETDGSLQGNEKYSEYGLLFRIVGILEEGYIDELDQQELLEGAIEGMLGALNDPQTTFLGHEETEDLLSLLKGSFGGVGVRIVDTGEGITVVEVLPESPALKAGVHPGDRIRHVDQIDIKNRDVDKVVQLIRGRAGSKIVIGIERPGSEKEIEFSMEREEISFRTVTGELVDNDIACIRVSQFDGGTGHEFVTMLEKFEAHGLRGLVLDLRDNPGGLFMEALKIARVLVPEGEIVRIVERDGTVKEIYYSDAEPRGYPMVVLINSGSASGAEIIAGALKDREAALLVGKPTYGKATVQNFETFEEGQGLRYTVAKYVTPSGFDLHGEGLTPDFDVDLPPIYQYYYHLPPGKLEKGDFGTSVYLLQEMLVTLGYKIKLSGFFDGATEEELKKFQRGHDLSPHGKFDDTTWVYLRRDLDKVIKDRDSQFEKAVQIVKDRSRG
jgi:carboxyl-terminal processing protease